MNRANNSAFTCSNAFFLSRWQYRNFHSDTTRKSHVQKKRQRQLSYFFLKMLYPLIHLFHRHRIIFQRFGDMEIPRKMYCSNFLGNINIQPAEER